MKFRIPQYAKDEAKRSLKLRASLPPSKQFGLSKKEAKRLRINSGVARAEQIVNNTFISLEDAKAIVRFYDRFKNCRTFKCEGSIGLWGGRRWAKQLKKKIINS